MPSHKTDINVGIKFNADTSQAKQQIQQLSYDLNKIASMKTNSLMPQTEIEKIKQATQAARELQIHLSKAFNPTTNTLNLVDFNKSLQSTGSNINTLSNKLINAGDMGKRAFVSLAQSIATANQPMLKTNALLGQMWITLKNTIRWQISSSIFQGFISSVQKATTYVKDLNKSLTDIRIVTGYNIDYMTKFAAEANKAAKALNTTTNEYAKASLIYFQQGLNSSEVKERTDVTIKLANVTRESAQTVSDQMTAIWNNFDDGSKSLEYYADVITALGAATASSTDEISQGLEKFAAVAETVGLSYEYATAALATITSNTRQSADVVGTALKTLFARIQGLSLGETLEDGTDLTKYSEALDKVGIDIKESNGELKDMDKILDEMAAKWNTISSDQQVALAQTVAGVRQYTQLVALMENWSGTDNDNMMANLNTVANAEGTLQEQADIYAESWEAASKRAKAALEEIYSTILDDSFFIKLTDSFAGIVENLNKFFKSIDGLKGVLQGLSLLLVANFSKNIPQAISNFASNVQYAFLGASSQAKKAANDMQQAFTNINKNDFTELQNFQLEKASYLITLRQRAAEMAKQQSEAEKLQSQIAVQGFEQEINSIETLIARRNELNSSLYSIANNSIYEYADAKSGGPWDDGFFNSEFFRTNEDAIQKLINKYQDLKAARDSATKMNGSEIFQQNITFVNSLSQAVRNQELTLEEAKSQLLAYADFLKTKFGINFNEAALNSKNFDTAIKEVVKSMTNFAPNAKNAGDIIKNNFNISTSEANKTMGAAIGIISNYKQKILELKGTFEETYVSINRTVTGFEMLSKSFGTIYSLSMVFQTLGNTWKTIQDPDSSGWDAVLKTFTSLGFAIPMAMNAFKSFKDYVPTKVLSEEAFLKSSKYKDKYVSQYVGGKTRENIQKLDLSNLTKEEQDILNNPNNYHNTTTNHYLKDEYQTELKNIDAKKQKAHEQKSYDKYVKSSSIKSALAYGAVLAGVAFALALMIKYYKQQQELKPEAQLKRATENAQNLKQAADEAKNALEGLKSTLESYDTASKELEKLTAGTEKFSEKLEEANAQAIELIKTYGIVDGITIGKNGEIEITKAAREEAFQKYEQQLGIANLNSIYADRLQREANEKVEWSKLEKKYSKLTVDEISKQSQDVKNTGTSSSLSKSGAGQWAYNKAEVEAPNIDISELISETFLNELDTKSDIERKEQNDTERKDFLTKTIFGENKIYNDLTTSQQKYIDTLDKNSEDFRKYGELVEKNNKANEAALKIQLHQNALNDKNYADSKYQNDINTIQLEKYNKLYEEYLLVAQETREDNSRKKGVEELLQEIVVSNTEDIYANYQKGENGNYNILDKDGNVILVVNANENLGEIEKLYASTLANANIQNSLNDSVSFIEEEMKKYSSFESGIYSGLIQNDVSAGGVSAGYWWNKATDEQKKELINQFDDKIIKNFMEKNKIANEEALIKFLNEWYMSDNNPYQSFIDALTESGFVLDENAKDQWKNWYSQLTDEERTILAEIEIDENASQDNLNEAIKNIQKKNQQELQVNLAFSDAATTSFDKIEKINDIYNDYLDNKKLSRENFSELEENYKDVDGFSGYIAELANEDISPERVQEILSEIAIKSFAKEYDSHNGMYNLGMMDSNLLKNFLIDAGFSEKDITDEKILKLQSEALDNYYKDLILTTETVEGLTEEEKDRIAILKANKIATKGVVDETEYLSKKEEILEEVVKDTKDALSKEDTILNILEGSSEETKVALFYLWAQEQILNNSELDLSEKIEMITQMGIAAGLTADAIGGITRNLNKSVGWISYATEKGLMAGQGSNWELLVDEETLLKEKEAYFAEETKGYVGDILDILKGTDLTKDEDSSEKNKEEEFLEYEDEIERYHENTRQLERLTRALEKVSTAKDRAFGKHRLALIDDEIEATEALVQQQRALLAETREYLKQDFAEIQQYGFTYDEFGELTNYDEVMKAQIDKYNAVVATGNAAQIEQAKKEYEEFKENMEQYEETLTAYEEAQAQLQEYINQVVDLKLEKITTEVEIKILVNDKELTRLEYLLRKIEYEGKGAADAIALMGRQFEQISEKAKPIQEAIDKIYEQAREEGRGLLEEEVKEIKTFYEDNNITEEEKKRIQEIYNKAAAEDRMLTQAEEEQIQEYKEQLLELNQEVMDIVETIEGKFIEVLDELNGKVEESIGRFATYTGMYQTLSEVITLSGKANSKYGMDMLNALSAKTVANASQAMKANLQNYEAFNKIYLEEQANLERAIQIGEQRLIDYHTERMHEVEMKREASYESMLSSWAEALQAANDLFDTQLNNMIIELKQNIGDIDKLVEIYDRATELKDLYLSGNKSIYELSKLARSVGKDIEDTSNLIAKNKLVGFLEQINKLRAEGVKLSQYDLEYWQAKYELELAEIALQEAQDAKAQVKLTRNTAGGWGYTYVADAEAIGEAQQKYEDSMYAMSEVNDQYINDYSDRLIKNRQEMTNALQDLDTSSLTYEEDLAKTRDYYFKQEEYLMAELMKAYERAGISYSETILGQVYGDASLQDSHNNFVSSITRMIEDELIPAYQDFKGMVDNINDSSGTTLENAMGYITDASQTLESEVTDRITDLVSGVKEASDAIWDFQETYGDSIARMLATNEDYYSKTILAYQNFLTETEVDKWLDYYEDMVGPGVVVGTAGTGTAGKGGTSTAAIGANSSAMTSWSGNNLLSGDSSSHSDHSSKKSSSSSSKSKISDKDRLVIGPDSVGVALNDDGTYSGIATIYRGQEQIPEAAMRALRDDPALKGDDLYKYDTNGDGGLNADELEEALKKNNVKLEDYIDEEKDHVKSFGQSLATGGYTGSWGPEGKWALLHEKELVLNKFDTENMLDMVNTLRDIDWRAKLAELWDNIQERFITPMFGGKEQLDQNVHIEASFPGVSDRNEIQEAFNNLINTASQWSNRKIY